MIISLDNDAVSIELIGVSIRTKTMADKFPGLNFDIPSEVFDIHEWVADEFIDGDMGSNCTLIFPAKKEECDNCCLLYTSPSPRDRQKSRMPSSA